MMLLLKMGRMHVKELYGIQKISCPQEHPEDEEDWIAAYPNLYHQNQLHVVNYQYTDIMILKKQTYYHTD